MHLATALLLGAALAAPLQDPPARDPGTWILMIEGDVTRLAVTGAAAREFAWQAPRTDGSEWRIVLLDERGKEIAATPLDLAPFCSESGHAGRAPHLDGDVVREHRITTTVKVPARADLATIRIERRQTGKPPAVVGSIDRTALLALLRKSEEKRR